MRVAGGAAPQGYPWWRAGLKSGWSRFRIAYQRARPARLRRTPPCPELSWWHSRTVERLPDLGTRMDGRTGASLVESGCAGCGEQVRVRLDIRTAEGPNWDQGAITYADADIAVWECPVCGLVNLMRSTSDPRRADGGDRPSRPGTHETLQAGRTRSQSLTHGRPGRRRSGSGQGVTRLPVARITQGKVERSGRRVS
jgi:hypothetical protein